MSEFRRPDRANQPGQLKRNERGNAMLEFALASALLIPILTGVFQYGYCYYQYNNLESSIRWAAEYASRISYDSTSETPSDSYASAVKNMAVYGDPVRGTTPAAPGLTTNNIKVTMQFVNYRPAITTVTLEHFTFDTVFGSMTYNQKPSISFPYVGRWDLLQGGTGTGGNNQSNQSNGTNNGNGNSGHGNSESSNED